ncbi:hypothetical protein D3C87_1647320 [compost metagenome]
MPHAVSRGTGVRRFASQAPSQTPGQMRNPRISMAAKAMPVGAQTGDTFRLRKAMERPSLAAAT